MHSGLKQKGLICPSALWQVSTYRGRLGKSRTGECWDGHSKLSSAPAVGGLMTVERKLFQSRLIYF